MRKNGSVVYSNERNSLRGLPHDRFLGLIFVDKGSQYPGTVNELAYALALDCRVHNARKVERRG